MTRRSRLWVGAFSVAGAGVLLASAVMPGSAAGPTGRWGIFSVDRGAAEMQEARRVVPASLLRVPDPAPGGLVPVKVYWRQAEVDPAIFDIDVHYGREDAVPVVHVYATNYTGSWGNPLHDSFSRQDGELVTVGGQVWRLFGPRPGMGGYGYSTHFDDGVTFVVDCPPESKWACEAFVTSVSPSA